MKKTAVKDERLFMRFPITFPDDPKIAPLSDAAFRAFVEMNAYSRVHDLDGVLPKRLALSRWGKSVQELLDADEASPILVEVEAGYFLTKYERHQFTSHDLAEMRAAKSRAGRIGAAKRWHGDSAAIADAKQVPSKSDGKTWPESESESESESELDTNYFSREGLEPDARDFQAEEISGIRHAVEGFGGAELDDVGIITLAGLLLEASPRPVANRVGYVVRCTKRSPAKVRGLVAEAVRQVARVRAELGGDA